MESEERGERGGRRGVVGKVMVVVDEIGLAGPPYGTAASWCAQNPTACGLVATLPDRCPPEGSARCFPTAGQVKFVCERVKRRQKSVLPRATSAKIPPNVSRTLPRTHKVGSAQGRQQRHQRRQRGGRSASRRARRVLAVRACRRLPTLPHGALAPFPPKLAGNQRRGSMAMRSVGRHYVP